MDSIHLKNLLFPSMLALVLFFATLAIYRLVFHPLARFPGPKLAAVTRWYEGYYDVILDGQYTFKIRELHKKYGPIVRISPEELHIGDPDFFERLYRQDGRWFKYPWAYDPFGAPNAAICTIDHDVHKRRRGALNSFFSKANVGRRADIIRKHLGKLCDRFDGFVADREVLDIGAAISAVSVDIATEFILGEPYGNVQRKDFNTRMTHVLQGSNGIWRTSKHLRFVEPMVKAIPIWFMEKIANEHVAAFLSFLKYAERQTQRLMSNYVSTPITTSDTTEDIEKSIPPPTIVHAILRSPNLSPPEKEITRIKDEVSTVTGAGLETVATALRFIVYHVYSDPNILSRLRTEVCHLPHDATLSQLENSPFLTAVLKEGLRLMPGVGTRLARIADRDLVCIDGHEYDDSKAKEWIIPAGTPVGMTLLLMQRDENLYGQDANSFRPERWLESDDRKQWVESKHFAPFSRGTRNCLGMHLAWAELYMMLSTFVRFYDFDLAGAGTTEIEVTPASDQFIIGTEHKNGLKAFVRPNDWEWSRQ